ncbi:hypothetical protein EAO70_31990 [Streptomyces sp. adm13(2018)]|nr:hypothetical protein EAO70_31990 [Streptomyces sp. adm13(2018)]
MLRAAPFVERLRRLALEVDDGPAAVGPAQGLPEVQVAVDALDHPRARRAARRREDGAQPGDERQQRRHGLCRRVQPAVHGGHQPLGLVAAEPPRGQRLRERQVDLGRGPAERPRLRGEVPSVGERVEREPPAVAGVPEVRLEDAQRRRARLEPGDRFRDPGAPGAREGEGELQIGVGPRTDPAEDLEDERISVDERGVGLLGVQHPGGEGGRQLRGGVEAQRAGPARAAQPLVEEAGEPRVAQPFVHGASGERPLPDPPDQGGGEAGGQLGPYAQEQLVAVGGRSGRPAGLFHPYEQMEKAGSRAVQGQQLGGRVQRESGDPSALAREPALPGQPFVEQGREGRKEGVRGPGGGCGLRHGIASFPRGAQRTVVCVQMRRVSRMAAGAVRMCGTCRRGKIRMGPARRPGWT